MKKYNWKKLNESFFDDIEEDIIENDSQLEDNIQYIIDKNTSILYSKTTDDIVDALLQKFNIGNFIYNQVPFVINTLLKRKQEITRESFIKTYDEIYSDTVFTIFSPYVSMTICRFTDFDPNDFLTTVMTGSSNNKNVRVQFIIEQTNFGYQFRLVSLDIGRESNRLNLPIYTWNNDNTPNMSKNNMIKNQMRSKLTEVMDNFFKRCGGLDGVLKELKHLPSGYTILKKDLDRMEKIVYAGPNPKLGGYEAINNLQKKIPRIAAWYQIKFGHNSVKELSDNMFIGWCLYKDDIVCDPRNLIGLQNIYIKDVVYTIKWS